MRWLVVIFLLLVLLITDQYRFRGYYSSEIGRFLRNAITSITR